MGTDFFPQEGKNASKIVRPPKMALGEGRGGDNFCPPRGEAEGGRGGYFLSLFFYFGQMTEMNFFWVNDVLECRANDFFLKLSSFWLFGEMTTLIFRGSAGGSQRRAPFGSR